MKNGLKDLFDQFAATAGDSAEMWKFYDSLSTPVKIIVWTQFPEHHEALRQEERRTS
jgi:hypothetical protein